MAEAKNTTSIIRTSLCVCVCVCVCVQNELHMPQWFCGKLNHVFSAERVGFIFN